MRLVSAASEPTPATLAPAFTRVMSLHTDQKWPAGQQNVAKGTACDFPDCVRKGLVGSALALFILRSRGNHQQALRSLKEPVVRKRDPEATSLPAMSAREARGRQRPHPWPSP